MWLVNVLGLVLIAGIVWWFWLHGRRQAVSASQGVIEIAVEDGVYAPASVEIPLNRATTLRFTRKDASPCAGTVLFSDFDISADLPLNKPKDIVLTPTQAGTFAFTCQMQMYRGELRVSADG